jgi:aspartate aminotransferase-like enzyme
MNHAHPLADATTHRHAPPRNLMITTPVRFAVPAFPAERYRLLADRLGGVLGSRGDVVFVQGEAIIALEALAASIGRPGLRVLVLVTSPYGDVFARWLEATGAEVRRLRSDGAEADEVAAIESDMLEAELAEHPADAVYITHGEAATGVVNPLQELAAVARAHGALVLVDAVASVGGHELRGHEWGLDVVVAGAQKSLAGPSSLSFVSVTEAGWAAIARGSAATRGVASVLSLLDLKRGWLDAGRGALPGMPDPLSFWALDHAVDAVLAEGVDAVIERHARASALARSALRALGPHASPAPVADARASHLVTLAPVPEGASADALLDAARRLDETISPAQGAASGRFLRLNHTGARANHAAVATGVLAYAAALRRLGAGADVDAAADVLGAV